jgi:hypothetical protein
VGEVCDERMYELHEVRSVSSITEVVIVLLVVRSLLRWCCPNQGVLTDQRTSLAPEETQPLSPLSLGSIEVPRHSVGGDVIQ